MMTTTKTKQEKIMKGIATTVTTGRDRGLGSFAIAKEILQYEDSQGVVIKVERESLSCGHIGLSVAHGNTSPKCPLMEAGYCAVGPLIEVK